MHICQFETPNFDFIAAGSTAHEAWDSLVSAWRVHCEQTGADPDYLDRDGCHEYELSPGKVLRDHEPMNV